MSIRKWLLSPVLRELRGVHLSLYQLGVRMSLDLTRMEATVAALEAKGAETNATLAGLAQAVVDLKNTLPPSDDPAVQAKVDELTARAEGVLAGITVAEDAADDQLPAA